MIPVALLLPLQDHANYCQRRKAPSGHDRGGNDGQQRALQEAGGDFEQAIDLLRKKGQKVAAKRADREANQGLVIAQVSDDGKTGILVEVNCETDFVARNDDFSSFARAVAEAILRQLPADMDSLLALALPSGRSVGEVLTELTGTIGEKLGIRRFAVLDSRDGRIVPYSHPGARLGVLVEIAGDGELQATGRDIAMQVAALDPVAVVRDEIPERVRVKELEIAREAARLDGKPERIIDRIATGKLERYYKDHVLVEQPFVKDASLRVRHVLAKAGAQVRTFVRYALGS